MALTQVSGGGIKDGSITNADLDSSAAIDGSKVSPDFGSQDIATSGTVTGAALVPSGATAPTNGVYLPAANSVGISTNGTQRLLIDANGNANIDSGTVYVDATNNRVGLGTSDVGAKLHVVDNNLVSTYLTLATADSPTVSIVNQATNVYARIAGGNYATVSSVNLDLASNRAKNKDIQGGWRLKSLTGATASSATGSNFQIVPTTYTSSDTITEGSAALTIDQSGNTTVNYLTSNNGVNSAVSSTSSLPLSISSPGETYGTSYSANGIYNPAGTQVVFGNTNQVAGAASLLYFSLWNNSNQFTGAYIGSTAGSVTNGSANVVFGRRTAAQVWQESARIDSSGRLLIGTSSASGSANVQSSNSVRANKGVILGEVYTNIVTNTTTSASNFGRLTLPSISTGQAMFKVFICGSSGGHTSAVEYVGNREAAGNYRVSGSQNAYRNSTAGIGTFSISVSGNDLRFDYTGSASDSGALTVSVLVYTSHPSASLA